MWELDEREFKSPGWNWVDGVSRGWLRGRVKLKTKNRPPHIMKTSPQHSFGKSHTLRLAKRKAPRELLGHLMPTERDHRTNISATNFACEQLIILITD